MMVVDNGEENGLLYWKMDDENVGGFYLCNLSSTNAKLLSNSPNLGQHQGIYYLTSLLLRRSLVQEFLLGVLCAFFLHVLPQNHQLQG